MAEGGGGHDGGGGMRWLLTYADLITLMMVFFVVMYSMANVDKQKYSAVAGALRKAFGGDRVVGLPGTGAGEPGGQGPGPGGGERRDPMMSLAQQLSEVQQKAAGLLRQGGGEPPAMQVYLGQRGVAISLAGSALFNPDDDQIRPAALPLLAMVADKLRTVPNAVSVEGYEADTGETGSFERAWRLSQGRAAAITRYLIEAQGLPPTRFSMVAYGQFHPVASNTDAVGRAENRRVDVVLLRTPPDLDRGEPVSPGGAQP